VATVRRLTHIADLAGSAVLGRRGRGSNGGSKKVKSKSAREAPTLATTYDIDPTPDQTRKTYMQRGRCALGWCPPKGTFLLPGKHAPFRL